jgi:hypothetical protein
VGEEVAKKAAAAATAAEPAASAIRMSSTDADTCRECGMQCVGARREGNITRNAIAKRKRTKKAVAKGKRGIDAKTAVRRN